MLSATKQHSILILLQISKHRRSVCDKPFLDKPFQWAKSAQAQRMRVVAEEEKDHSKDKREAQSAAAKYGKLHIRGPVCNFAVIRAPAMV